MQSSKASTERFTKFVTELMGESDRGAILICAIACESALKRLITANSVSETHAKDILATRSGLDSWKNIAHTFGLISSQEALAIQTIGNIRNKIAHDSIVEGNPFASEYTQNLVRQMAFAPKMLISKMKRENPEMEKVTKIAFIIAATETLLKLDGRLANAERPLPPDEVPDWFGILTDQRFLQDVIREIAKALQTIPTNIDDQTAEPSNETE